jgi:transcription elongation GreA/GreB family factor
MIEIKEALLKECKSFVEKRLKNIEETISSHQKALQTETKSSAGDKHETGRAMLQLEMEKAGKQLLGVSKMNQILSQIDTAKKSNIANLGSVICTSNGNYFLSISAGKIEIEEGIYYAVSIASPIGQLLLGKEEEGDFIIYSNKINIDSIF